MNDASDRSRRVGLIVLAIVTRVAAIGMFERAWLRPASEDATVQVIGASTPISEEADVFRTGSQDLALGPDLERRRPAHPRTLATYRALRAYPGAPPRIPHGLTREEFRTASCNTCHERGGYSDRF